MKTSTNGINLLKNFEAFRGKAYQDVVGIWTIGYGTTRINGVPVKFSDVCNEQQAVEYLQSDLVKFETVINEDVKVPVTQNQFDALACFTYNVGIGAFGSSTLLRKLNAGDYSGAANQLLLWNKAGNKVVAGLTNRRQSERSLFLS
jgi:lysozyme